METIHTFESTVEKVDKSYNFLGEVYDEPCVKTAEHGNFYTKVTIHECSDKGAKRIGELVYPNKDEKGLKRIVKSLTKNIDKTLKCL